MACYKISLKRSVEKDLRKIDKSLIPKIVSTIENLAENPFPIGSRRLVGSNHTHRFRIGDYRIVYFIDSASQEIEIQRIRHRKDVYK